MKLETLYRKAVAAGMANDLRGPDELRRLLDEERAKSKKLKDEEREAWEEDRLFNPFADTRILAGDPRPRSEGHRRDRHGGGGDPPRLRTQPGPRGEDRPRHRPPPRGRSPWPSSPTSCGCSPTSWPRYGVTVSVAEQLMDKRIGEVERRLLPVNHDRAVDAARMLGLPMMCVHTPADNCVTSFLNAAFREGEARPGSRTSSTSSRRSRSTGAAAGRMAGPRSSAARRTAVRQNLSWT